MELASSYILDTSAYSAFFKGDRRLRPWFTHTHKIFLPLVVIGELRAGFANGNRTSENETLLGRFLDTANVDTLPLSLSTTKFFADTFLQVKKSGKALGTNDLWIAALAKEHSLPILTLDADFQRIKGVELLAIPQT